MAFLDEREDAPTPEKEGIYYVKEDPDLERSGAWTPGRWRTASTSSAWRRTRPRAS